MERYVMFGDFEAVFDVDGDWVRYADVAAALAATSAPAEPGSDVMNWKTAAAWLHAAYDHPPLTPESRSMLAAVDALATSAPMKCPHCAEGVMTEHREMRCGTCDGTGVMRRHVKANATVDSAPAEPILVAALKRIIETANCRHWAGMNEGRRSYAMARDAQIALDRVAALATSAPSEPATTETEDKLHAAICHAVSIMNNSFDIARSTEGREAKDILRRALLDYADAPSAAQPEAPAEPMTFEKIFELVELIADAEHAPSSMAKIAKREHRESLREALAALATPAAVVVPAELSDDERRELLGVLKHLRSEAVRYLPDYNEHSAIQDADAAIEKFDRLKEKAS